MELIHAFSVSLQAVWADSGFIAFTIGNAIMILVGLVLLYLAIVKEFEPLLLGPIAFGCILANFPNTGFLEEPGLMQAIHYGIANEIFPPLIFLGIGAMTDFGPLIARPQTLLLGAAAQIGVFIALIGAMLLGFTEQEAGAIGIIGGADGPTAIYMTIQLAPHLLGAIAVAAYSYMSLVPLIQPPIMKLLTTRREREVQMEQLRPVTKFERLAFPVVSAILISLLLPPIASLLGMMMLGNLMRESGVMDRLSDTAQNSLCNIVTIFLATGTGLTMTADSFLRGQTLLIIALGLLVDDAIIAVEMMSVKLEMGMNRFDAACYAFKATARPMLTGTLITCAGFIPVAFAKGMASEFCSTLFPVITAALILSWIASVMVAPLYGTYLIKVKVKRDAAGRIDPYQSRFYTWFRGVLHWFMTHRRIVLVGTAAAFILSLCLMTFVKQEFFPQSLRPEILVEMRLPEGSSMQATQEAADRMSDFLKERADRMENYSYYVGQYAPRFVLTIDPKTDRDNAAQFVVVAKDSASRTALTKEIQDELDSEFPEVQSSIQFLQTGPPADHPVMLRVTGRTPKKTKELAEKVVAQLAKDPNNYNIRMDWGQKSKVMHVSLDQERLAAMGLSTQDVAHMLYTEVSGAKAAEFYAGDRTIDIDLRLAAKDRMSLGDLNSLPIYLGAAGYTTLDQIAKISYDAEEGLIGRYDLMPSIVVSADVHEGLANDVTKKALADTADIAKDLPFGASIRAEGALKNSNTAIDFLLVPIPAMIFCIMTLLMFQLRRVKDMLITLLTAPMGLIGVAAGMLVLNKAMGFVAMLGVFALSGMIIRNSVILIDQIQKHIADGESPWNAVADSAILRFRPILLTAAAAILGMVPLMLSPFWGPMAVAIASGLIAATVLTLLVLPAMYVTVYRIHP